MIDIHIQLSILWICLMLIYLLGDVLRIFAGDFKPGEINGEQMPKNMYLFIASFMVIPIIMALLTLILPYPINRWANMIIAGIFFAFNIVGIPSYPGAYDKFLLIISLGFNVATIWYAWNWIA